MDGDGPSGEGAGIQGMRWAVLFLLCANGAEAQSPAWPGFNDPRLNLAVHDALHGVTAMALAEGLRLVPGMSEERTARYVLGTLALPVAQEFFDWVYWHKIEGYPWSWAEPLNDFVTYQGAWAVYFAEKRQWIPALGVTVAWVSFLWWRNYKHGGINVLMRI